ncbi:MAG: N-acetyl-1-D-myo-inositol-2-amino-2-deoxy-alpha-D-glucopyranoside deacetylase [Actinomycetota bacterium]|nr:N-acetyl-1-D-myo-inositol-2-amino-2-deoxy-alpha-D-glucopyranoside deacetylase [Actinomycetota bacterium]
MPEPARRMVLVHAHPDDESINNGATMAKYAAAGVAVTLVTCTLGEEGEVLVPELEHIGPQQEDRLGEHRIGELATAMQQLGVRHHRFLGKPGRYRDSGMMGTPANDRPDCFWRADLREAADELLSVLREVRPQVLVTYDEFGGYGHPDHIQAHRVATYATALAAVPSYRLDLGAAWDVPKVYWTAVSARRLREGLRRLRVAGDATTFEGLDPDGELPPFAVEDDQLTARVDGTDFVVAKLAAMRAHATQISVDGPFFALSNNLGNEVWAEEYYRLAKGRPGEPDPATGLESDLFAGLG